MDGGRKTRCFDDVGIDSSHGQGGTGRDEGLDSAEGDREASAWDSSQEVGWPVALGQLIMVEAVTSLRRWMRWLRRAVDIELSLPDSTILLKEVSRLSRKVLQQQPKLQFRCSLIRKTLQLDTVPTAYLCRAPVGGA